jgi:nitrite reductase (NADH) large subunit
VAGELTLQNLFIHTQEWYQNKEISIHLEEPITEVNVQKKEVTSQKGKTYDYDSLLMATGGREAAPGGEGAA